MRCHSSPRPASAAILPAASLHVVFAEGAVGRPGQRRDGVRRRVLTPPAGGRHLAGRPCAAFSKRRTSTNARSRGSMDRLSVLREAYTACGPRLATAGSRVLGKLHPPGSAASASVSLASRGRARSRMRDGRGTRSVAAGQEWPRCGYDDWRGKRGNTPRTTGSIATMDIAELLAFSVKNKASDLHLSAGLPPMIRVDGDVRRINIPALDKQVHALVYDIMSDKQRRDYEEFSRSTFRSRSRPGALPRQRLQPEPRRRRGVPHHPPRCSPRGPGLPAHLQGTDRPAAGPDPGHRPDRFGQVDHARGDARPRQQERVCHILSIEDPIEFVHTAQKCLINQREVHRDTHGFNEALRSALREDPTHPGRRNARHRDHPPRPDRGRDRPPGVRDPAHLQRGRPSTASSTCSRRARSRWCARCCPNRCAR